MAKLMMLIWMMIGVLTMSKAVSSVLVHANWQLSMDIEMHGTCCVTVCPTVCKVTAHWHASAKIPRQAPVCMLSLQLK